MPSNTTFKNRQKKFAQAYVDNGFNGQRAYQSIKPNVTAESARVSASRLLTSDNVQAEIKRRVEAITPESILDRINDIANDSEARRADKLRALELLGKYHAMFKDTQVNNLNIISDKDLDQIRAKLSGRSGATSIEAVPTLDSHSLEDQSTQVIDTQEDSNKEHTPI